MAHRVLSKALKDAVANEELVKNVAKTKTAPKVTDEEMVIAVCGARGDVS